MIRTDRTEDEVRKQLIEHIKLPVISEDTRPSGRMADAVLRYVWPIINTLQRRVVQLESERSFAEHEEEAW